MIWLLGLGFGVGLLERFARDWHPVPAGGVKAPSYPLAKLEPKAGNAARAQRIKALEQLLDKVWTDVTGRPGPMPPAAKEIAMAQAAAEGSGFGQGWDGDMASSWNVGSFQCGGTQQDTAYYRCVQHEDSRPEPDGSQKKYVTTFRYYKDGVTPDGKSRSAAEAGAWDFLHSITVKPFPALDELLSGDVLAYARKQYGQHYFEGFNLSPEGQTAYAASIKHLVAGGVPVRKAGETPEMVAGRIAFYAGAMGRALPEIAAALGHAKVHASVPAELMVWKPAYQAKAGAAVA